MSAASYTSPDKKTGSARGIKIAIAGYVLLLIIQLAAFFSTGTLVLLAMAFESLSSLVVAAFLLLAIYVSTKPADKFHNLGYERAQNLAAVIAAVVFISFMSLETFRRAIPKFFEGPPSAPPGDFTIPLIVSIISLLVACIPIIDIVRSKSPGASVQAQLLSSLEDLVSYGSGLAGIVLVGYGYYLADPIFSIVIAIFIALTGIYLIKKNVRFLLGKSPDPELKRKVEEVIRATPGVIDLHSFKAEYVGPETLFAGFHVTVDKDMTMAEANRLVKEIKSRVGEHTGCQHCVVEIEPHDALMKTDKPH